MTKYVTELKYLAVHCDFRDQLEDAVRDQLVCGLKSSHIQRSLLSESDLTYAKAVKLAMSVHCKEWGIMQHP